MRKIFISLLLLLGVSLQLSAQKDIMKEPIPVAMFQATYAFQLPAFDTKTSFGVNSTIGASFVTRPNPIGFSLRMVIISLATRSRVTV